MSTKDELDILCQNIKILRIRHGLSRKKMAQIMGIGVSTLAKLESGIMPPRTSAAVVFRLATYFKISSDQLFFPLK